jgi:hypothetical protein
VKYFHILVFKILLNLSKIEALNSELVLNQTTSLLFRKFFNFLLMNSLPLSVCNFKGYLSLNILSNDLIISSAALFLIGIAQAYQLKQSITVSK